MLTHADIFEEASIGARMGIWECELPSERLSWSTGTYDLFGLPRGIDIVRSDILKSYTEQSLVAMSRVRQKGIESEAGFRHDAEIRTPEGEKRWIRISATVERRHGEPIRLFGIKQDITEEKLLLEHTRHLAEFDAMTGLANRSQFQRRLAAICESGGSGGALMLVDLDNFKEVNDTYGHAIGDECLVAIARRIADACHSADLIARFGGDEFVALFGPGMGRERLQTIADQVLRAVRAPLTCSGHTFSVGASIGLSLTENGTPADAFLRADDALYAAKWAGRGTFRGLAPETDRRAG
ncbi:MAG TPA: GGDEF domain-containing protein [Devosiaceae bacterium]|nr:GGDEF domain-containing protein [Devosiaceae bacterium]